METLNAIVASLWPQKYRKWRCPDYPPQLALGAFLSGLIEGVLFSWLEFLQFRAHFLAQADYFAQGNEGTQLVALFAVVVAELFYPISFVLIFFALEGFVRAMGGAILDEQIPSLPLAVGVRLWDRYVRHARPLPY